jgi:integrating conjugative element protein (TIGR03752 family)
LSAGDQRDFGLEADEQPAGTGGFALPDTPNLINPNKSKPSSINSVGGSIVQDGDVEWIQPADAQMVMDKQTNKQVLQLPKFKGNKYSNPALANPSGNSMPVAQGSENKEKDDTLVPIYTIPENATMISSIGATALIGRVPLNNQVADPYPFKIVVGRKNLATNGISIPNLQGMVVSGLARGDFTLKCVYGEINSITYTFIDGTIRTVSSKSQGGGGGGNGRDTGGGSGSGGLGYISDVQGVPCVTGKYITNLPEYLAQLTAINTVSGMAEAFAQGQESKTTNTDSSTTSVVDGSSANMNFMLGKGIGKGVQSGADALAQRQQGAYDAVYVAPGKTVAIHITSEIDIDYDKKGRKVSHVAPSSQYSSNRGMD